MGCKILLCLATFVIDTRLSNYAGELQSANSQQHGGVLTALISYTNDPLLSGASSFHNKYNQSALE